MRKALLVSLPFLTILVISASFLLLTKQHLDNQAVLSVSQVAASTVNKSPVRKVKLIKSLIPTPTITKIPTPTKKPTPTPTAVKIITPTPTPTKPEATPISTAPVQVSTDTVQKYIMDRINEYRASQGLGLVSTDSNTCAFARTRVAEIVQSFNHDGFSNRINDHTLPYGSYKEVTENIAMNSDYTQVVTKWINSSGHAENMRKDTQFVCVEKSGNYYAYEGWKP